MPSHPSVTHIRILASEIQHYKSYFRSRHALLLLVLYLRSFSRSINQSINYLILAVNEDIRLHPVTRNSHPSSRTQTRCDERACSAVLILLSSGFRRCVPSMLNPCGVRIGSAAQSSVASARVAAPQYPLRPIAEILDFPRASQRLLQLHISAGQGVTKEKRRSFAVRCRRP